MKGWFVTVKWSLQVPCSDVGMNVKRSGVVVMEEKSDLRVRLRSHRLHQSQDMLRLFESTSNSTNRITIYQTNGYNSSR